jgi:cytochrome c oxidase assembly factor CtaG
MGTVAMHLLIFCLVLLANGLAYSHETESVPAWTQWSFEPWVVVCLGLSLALYVIGMKRLWRRMRHGHAQATRQAAAFLTGWLALVAALVSPLDALGNWLFSAHMLQHELLMIVAAPLLVLSRPLSVWLWALPSAWRQGAGGAVRTSVVRVPWRALSSPAIAWSTHAAVLWAWHVPILFDAALASEPVHVAQHLSFFLSALLFWWTVLGDEAARPSRGAAMLYLFTTMLHTGALGALLTLSGRPWYPAYVATRAAAGMSALEDQQLGGLIMWIPGALAYVIAGLALGAQWLRQTLPATRRAEPGKQ